MHLSTLIQVTLLTTSSLAQTAYQNATAASLAAQIPSCALPCDDAAIKSVDCALTDYACHCAHGAQLAVIIPPCLANSTCTSADLQTFGAIPPKICAALNGTATSNSTSTASPTPVSVSWAGRNSASSLFAVVGTGVLGVLMSEL
ncbi:hypothetical protein G7Y89_g13044 [Cudoniella acicularis]|uniref:CFEM domain-containing protein n=1 Tax=Cudoniella acicularis TaxID=354080 RepID=A0A8H4VZ28_9HELO|nr:hypothetical protein G7Y89_g13044 [Cudoniella acicularis]